MRVFRVFRYLAALVLTSSLTLTLPAVAPADTNFIADLRVAASDEFTGTAGAPPDPRVWSFDIGGGGWGNNEKQVYTDSRDNSKLDGQGHLALSAVRNGTGFTSARLVTRGKAEFTFAFVEARIKFPSGKGLHPAFWLLGSNIGTVGWPVCGEIDVNELVNTGTTYHNAIHGPGFLPPFVWKKSADGVANGLDLAAGYHDYGVYRSPGFIAITIDRNIVGSYRSSDVPLGGMWVFDTPMYVILNIAVGGDWPGPVNETTPSPATMLVDWVRMYQ